MRTRRVWCLGAVLLLGRAPRAPADEPDVDLAGTWTWSWKDGQGETHRHVLEVEGRGKTLTARERFDDQGAVKVADLKVVGKKVNFTVIRGDRRATYSGEVTKADTIVGKVLVSGSDNQGNEYGWTAKREPVEKKSGYGRSGDSGSGEGAGSSPATAPSAG